MNDERGPYLRFAWVTPSGQALGSQWAMQIPTIAVPPDHGGRPAETACSLSIVAAVLPGGARVATFSAGLQRPDGAIEPHASEVLALTFDDPDERVVAFVLGAQFPVTSYGLYWLILHCDGRPLARVPFRIAAEAPEPVEDAAAP
jgi:hypothetical protein